MFRYYHDYCYFIYTYNYYLDLAFTISVWRSASDSIVGYFPKLHSIDTNTNSINGIFGWQYVWWYESYSIISSSAAVIHKRYMNEVNI